MGRITIAAFLLAGVTVGAGPSAALPRALRGAGWRAPFVCNATTQFPELEKQMLTLVNDARLDPRYRSETQGRARPLIWNAALEQTALCHSLDMAARGVLAHTSSTGLDPGARLDQAGIAWQGYGENVAMAPMMEEAENSFMREPPGQANHRGNLLNASFTEVGIGIARDGRGEYFITQDFLTPPGR